MLFLRAGMLVLSHGNLVDRYESSRHHNDTKANWTIVRVMGLGSAFKMDFEDVFVNAEVVYQIRQSICGRVSYCNRRRGWKAIL
jgi:hypothetical protein